MGYVLPWGQMSLWAAKVITKFLRAIPFLGKKLLMWVWGGFIVDGSLLIFFFSLHFIFPFILLLVIIFHFLVLHFKGSSSKTAFSFLQIKLKFSPYFLFKDFLNFFLLTLPFLRFSL